MNSIWGGIWGQNYVRQNIKSLKRYSQCFQKYFLNATENQVNILNLPCCITATVYEGELIYGEEIDFFGGEQKSKVKK